MRHPQRMDAIEACEQRLINLWPSVEMLLIGRWALRFANGYSGRANSASALWRDADLGDDDIALIEAFSRKAGVAPAIRLTPLAKPELLTRLTARGWSERTHSIGMMADVSPRWSADPRVALTNDPGQPWLDGVSALQDPSKSNPAHLAAIVGRIRLPVAFATLSDGGRPVGFGMAGVDRGWAEIGSIVLAPEARGRGLGRALVNTLLAFAATEGGGRVFLQVEATNAIAIALYRSLGFTALYEYRELRLPR